MLVSIRPASVQAAMGSVQYLREFIKERLTAVCEEIFSEVQKTIIQYEEEINRLHRQDINRKPDRNSHIIDLPKQHDCKEEEDLDEQQVCNQERNSSLDQEDPETPQIKEEKEELGSSQKGEQLGLKQEAEGIIVWTDKKQLRLLETIWKPVIKLHRIDVLQQHAFEEEEVLTDQHIFNQERNSSLDQEKPEHPQIKEEQEELCSSQKGEQLGLKQEADTFIVTPAYGESAYSKPELNSEQLLSHSSPEAETQDNEESQHVDSGTTRNTEMNKRRHSQRVDNPPVSSSKSRTDTKNKSVQCEVWIREHNPGSAMEAARLADVFVAARKKGQAWSHNAWKASRDTRKIPQQNHLDSANTSTSKTPQSTTRPPKASGKKLICYLCGLEGHTKPMCPRNSAKMVQMCFAPHSNVDPEQESDKSIKMSQIEVNGVLLNALFDSGSSRSLIHSDFAPPNIVLTSDTISICCVHGDEKRYPTADIYIKVQDQMYLLNVGVVNSLPYSAVLGRDLPVLFDLLESEQSEECNVVVTRAQAKQVSTHSETLSALPFFNEGFETTVVKPRKTRRQRRRPKKRNLEWSRFSTVLLCFPL